MQEAPLNFFQRFQAGGHHGCSEGRGGRTRLAYKDHRQDRLHGRGTQWASFSIDQKTGNVTWRLPDGNLDYAKKTAAVRGRGGRRVKTDLGIRGPGRNRRRQWGDSKSWTYWFRKTEEEETQMGNTITLTIQAEGRARGLTRFPARDGRVVDKMAATQVTMQPIEGAAAQRDGTLQRRWSDAQCRQR